MNQSTSRLKLQRSPVARSWPTERYDHGVIYETNRVDFELSRLAQTRRDVRSMIEFAEP